MIRALQKCPAWLLDQRLDDTKVFAQNNFLGNKNKWPLWVKSDAEKIICCSHFSPQLNSANDTFLPFIKSLALQVYNIHRRYRNTILNIVCKMECHAVSILLLWCKGECASFPADPQLIGSLRSLPGPVLWLFLSAHSHLSPTSPQVECEIHLFQGRNQSDLHPVTDHFVCSSRQFLLS